MGSIENYQSDDEFEIVVETTENVNKLYTTVIEWTKESHDFGSNLLNNWTITDQNVLLNATYISMWNEWILWTTPDQANQNLEYVISLIDENNLPDMRNNIAYQELKNGNAIVATIIRNGINKWHSIWDVFNNAENLIAESKYKAINNTYNILRGETSKSKLSEEAYVNKFAEVWLKNFYVSIWEESSAQYRVDSLHFISSEYTDNIIKKEESETHTKEKYEQSDIANIIQFLDESFSSNWYFLDLNKWIELSQDELKYLDTLFYNETIINNIRENQWKISLKLINDLWAEASEYVKDWLDFKLKENFWYDIWPRTNLIKSFIKNEKLTNKEISQEINTNKELQNTLKSYQLLKPSWSANMVELFKNNFLIPWAVKIDGEEISDYTSIYRDNYKTKARFYKIKERNKQINQRFANYSTKNQYIITWDEWWDDEWTQMAKDAWIWWEDLEWYSTATLKLSDEEKNQIKKDAFPAAWHNFIEKNEKIWEYINDMDMKNIYDFDNNTIRIEALKSTIIQLKNIFGDDIDVDNIKASILWFCSEMDDVIDELTKNYMEAKETSFDDSKVNAIGWVIDSISNIFDKISNSNWLCEGFKYAEKDPISLDWDLLTIKGLLNGEKTKICYNLRSGELFMNSFIKESNNPQMIKIWDRQDEKDGYPEADKNIWKIEKFEDIIPDIETSTEIVNNQPIDEVNYNRQIAGMNYVSNGWHSIQTDPDFHSSSPWTPQSQTNTRDIFDKMKLGNERWKKRRPLRLRFDKRRQPDDKKNMIRDKMRSIQKRPPEDVFLGNNMENNKLIFQNKMKEAIDLIWDSVKNYSDLQTKKNDIIIKFLKTFNIVNSQMGIKSMEFHEPSNIYWLLHIIENSEADQLDKFSDFMNIASKYWWLTRGENILPNQQENMMTKEIRESNENDEHNARWIIKKSLANFGNETSILWNQWTLKFDWTHSLSMAQLIIDNLIDNPKDKANSKLNTWKINNFLLSLDRNVSLDHNDGINNLEEGNPDKELEEQLNNI